MSIVRQESLFSIQISFNLELSQHYDEIFSAINIRPVVNVVAKKSNLGRPVELNYPAMVQALVIHRLLPMHLMKGISLMEMSPSMPVILKQEIKHHQKKEPETKTTPKKRGRKPRAEREQWLEEQEALEASLQIYEKKIEDKLPVSYDELDDLMPLDPKWGVKKNSEGKHAYWFGFKGHYAVETKTQFILHSMISSGSLNDGKATIPLLKGIQKIHPYFHLNYSIIAYNKKREAEPIGFDANFAPTCVREHSYRYDSFDTKYQTPKYTRPKECTDCTLAHESICQKVYKVKIETDLRRYSAPVRGSVAWKARYKERSSVERVNGYLKEFFQLNNLRYRTGKRAKVYFDLVTMVYNGMKLVSIRLGCKHSKIDLTGLIS